MDFSAADQFNEVVVSTATGNGAEFSLAIEGFEYDAGVIRQPANHVIIDFDEILKSPRGEVRQDRPEFARRLGFLDEAGDVSNGEPNLPEFVSRGRQVLGIQLIDDLIKLVFVGGLTFAGHEELVPGV